MLGQSERNQTAQITKMRENTNKKKKLKIIEEMRKRDVVYTPFLIFMRYFCDKKSNL
jgi:hypothetical protein